MMGICSYPEDMYRRLVYSDWLEEQGGAEKAEFIRVQCKLAFEESLRGGSKAFWIRIDKEHEITCECKYHTLRRRERELWQADQGQEWHYRGEGILAEIPSVVTIEQEDIVGWPKDALLLLYRRGFIEQVSCTCADWLQHGPQIVRAQPVLEVKLTDQYAVSGKVAQGGIDRGWLRYDQAIVWARGPHPALGLEALPPLEDAHVR